MYIVRNAEFSKERYSTIERCLKKDLVSMFPEQASESNFWLSTMLNSLKNKSKNKISLEVLNGAELLGFIVVFISEDSAHIRYHYIIETPDRIEALSALLNYTKEIIKNDYNNVPFSNSSFVVPWDYFSPVLTKFGYEVIERYNMTLKLKSIQQISDYNHKFKLENFSEIMFHEISSVCIESFKSTLDSKFWDDVTDTTKFCNLVSDSWNDCMIKECSFVIRNLDNNKIVGFSYCEDGDEGEAYLQDIVILPEYQGQGLGTALLEKILIELKNMGFEKSILTVTKDNKVRQLYEKKGFRIYTKTFELVKL